MTAGGLPLAGPYQFGFLERLAHFPVLEKQFFQQNNWVCSERPAAAYVLSARLQ